jgi:hypothetical protein
VPVRIASRRASTTTRWVPAAEQAQRGAAVHLVHMALETRETRCRSVPYEKDSGRAEIRSYASQTMTFVLSSLPLAPLSRTPTAASIITCQEDSVR